MAELEHPKGERKHTEASGFLSHGIFRSPARGWMLFIGGLAAISVLCSAKFTIGKEGLSLIPHPWEADHPVQPAVPPDDSRSPEALTRQLQAMAASTIPLDKLPPELRGNGTPEDAIRLIKEMSVAHENSLDTVESCIQSVDSGIAGRRFEINTNREIGDADMQYHDFVRCIETCLKVLGRYKADPDGRAMSLSTPIMDYQREKGLKVDGIIGLHTWKLIKADVQRILEAPQVRQMTLSMTQDSQLGQ